MYDPLVLAGQLGSVDDPNASDPLVCAGIDVK